MKSPLTGREMKLMSEPSTLNYRGKQYNVNHHFYLCELSNEQFTTTELDEQNLLELNKQVKLDFLDQLEQVIEQRKTAAPESSYVAALFAKGMNKIAQKVGEEAVELVIEAKDQNDELFLEESADLFFHYLMLLQAKGFKLADVVKILEKRHKP